MKLTNNPNEPQRVTLDIVFKVHHEPFNESHARALLMNYLITKGVEFNGEEIII
jgi:hypothetical protein